MTDSHYFSITLRVVLNFSHIRGEGDTLLEAIEEAISIGRETGASVQISHFKAARKSNWEKSTKALELIGQARSTGLDVTADLYPFIKLSFSIKYTEYALRRPKTL